MTADKRIHIGWRWANRFLAKTLRSFMQEDDGDMPDPVWFSQIIREAYSAGWDACSDHVQNIIRDPMNATYTFPAPTCPHCGHSEVAWRDGCLEFGPDEEGCLPVATLEYFRCVTCEREFTVRDPIPEEPL
jgi:hypothetical protein